MQVRLLHDGGIMDLHNQSHPDEAVQPSDMIIAVNGVHGDFDAMFAQFAKDSVVFEVERWCRRQ